MTKSYALFHLSSCLVCFSFTPASAFGIRAGDPSVARFVKFSPDHSRKLQDALSTCYCYVSIELNVEKKWCYVCKPQWVSGFLMILFK